MKRSVLAVVLSFVLLLSASMSMAQTPESTETAEAEGPVLVGVTWQWELFSDGQEQTTIETPERYTLTFTNEGRINVRADCNRIGGTYTAEDGSMTIMPGPSTLVACPPDSRGDEFVRYLSEAAIYSLTEGGQLVLDLPIDSGTLLFNAQPQVTGLVTYLQRSALPPDAIVRVQIEDVSIADAPSRVIGEQVIQTDGAQVPISFAVSYPESAVEAGNRYSVSARIVDGQGNLLFISDTIMPVITNDQPTEDIEIRVVPVRSS